MAMVALPRSANRAVERFILTHHSTRQRPSKSFTETQARAFGISVMKAPPATSKKDKNKSSSLPSSSPASPAPQSSSMDTDNPLHSIFMEPIHVLGAGSIGLLFAASIRIAFPSYPVRILLREHYAPALQNQQRDHNNQECISVCLQQQKRLKVVHIPAELISATVSSTKPPIRNLLLATKAFQAVPAVRSILSRLSSVGSARDNEVSSSSSSSSPPLSSSSSISSQTTNLIVLCNGALAVGDELQELLSQEQLKDSVRIVLATTTHGAFRERGNAQEENNNGNDDDGLFHVVHAGVGHTIIDDSAMPTPKLSGLLDRAGLVCSSSSSAAAMQTVLWRKLAANSVINPVTALRKIPNGQLLEQSDWKQLLQRITEEVAAVAAAAATTSSPQQQEDELTAASLQKYVEQVVRDTAANNSSMLQDVLAQRQTEIDYLSGYVVRRGRALGIDCPANEELWTQVRSLTASYTRKTDP